MPRDVLWELGSAQLGQQWEERAEVAAQSLSWGSCRSWRRGRAGAQGNLGLESWGLSLGWGSPPGSSCLVGVLGWV